MRPSSTWLCWRSVLPDRGAPSPRSGRSGRRGSSAAAFLSHSSADLRRLSVGGSVHGLARVGEPGRDLDRERPPGVLLAPAELLRGRHRGARRPPRAAVRWPPRRGRRARRGPLIDPARTQVPRTSTSAPRSSPTSRRSSEGVGLEAATRPAHCRRAASARSWTASRLPRRLAQARRRFALLVLPGPVEGALLAAHRAVAVAVGVVVRGGPRSRSGRGVARPGGGRRLRDRTASAQRRASPRRPPRPAPASGGSRLGELLGARRRPPAPAEAPRPSQRLVDRVEVPAPCRRAAVATCRARASSTSRSRSRRRPRASVASFSAFSRDASRFLQRAQGLDEVLEAQDRGERVVELRGPLVEERAELVVGEERTVGAQGRGPAEGLELRRLPCRGAGPPPRRLERRPRFPPARHHARPALALDEERRRRATPRGDGGCASPRARRRRAPSSAGCRR